MLIGSSHLGLAPPPEVDAAHPDEHPESRARGHDDGGADHRIVMATTTLFLNLLFVKDHHPTPPCLHFSAAVRFFKPRFF